MDPETRAYFDEMRRWLEAHSAAIDRRFDAVDRRFDTVDRRFVELDAELRRHFGVLIQGVRHELQIVAEMVVANTESIAQLRVRLEPASRAASARTRPPAARTTAVASPTTP